MTDWPWWRLAVVVMVVNSEGAYDGWLDWMGGFSWLCTCVLLSTILIALRCLRRSGNISTLLQYLLPHIHALMRSGDAAQPIGNMRNTT